MINEILTSKENIDNKTNKLNEKPGDTMDSKGQINEIEKRYEFIVNAYGELLTLINKDYEYELVNDSYCRSFSKSREDFIGKKISEVWGSKRFEEEIKTKIDLCFTGKIFSEEDSFVVSDGERRFYAVTYYPYKEENGDITHVAVVTNDITDRKIAEIALKESEEKLRKLNDEKDRYLKVINSDLEQASNYIKSLLPDSIDDNLMKIDWKIEFSSKLGGDSIGYHWIDDENFAFYICDVTGHGVGAALHSVAALNTLKYQTLVNTDFRFPDQVLKELNEVFQMSEHYSLFITMWYCVYNKTTRELKYAGAGHPPMIIIDSNNSASFIEAENVVIGIISDMEFNYNICKISSGTSLYLFTDGAFEIEADDSSILSIKHISEYLKTNNNKDANEIEGLHNHLVEINNKKLSDDFTMMKIYFT